MSVSAIFGTRMAAMPSTSIREAPPIRIGWGGVNGIVIECSSRPQKKATAHHKKTRPRKTQAWDIRRGPTVYPPLPSLPPEWTLVTDAAAAGGSADDDASAEQPAES